MSALDAVTATANAAFCHASDKVEHLLGQALQLDAADPKHIPITMEMAQALTHAFSVHARHTTSVLPMVLSVAAELQAHLDDSFCQVVSTPVWSNIWPEDPCCKASPLYPLTAGYGKPAPPTLAPPAAQPTAGPSKGKGKEKAIPEEDTDDDRGRQLECSKCARPRAMSARSQSAAPKAKCQRAKSKSKAIITSDDDMELDNAAAEVAAPEPAPAPAKPLKGVLKRPKYVEIDELDEEEAMIVGPAPKMGTPYVEIPLALKASGKVAGGLQEDTNADSTSPVWSPGCGGCVQRQLICRQGYNTSHEPLAVCARCHHAKNKCDEATEGDVTATNTTTAAVVTASTSTIPATTAPIVAAHDPAPDSQTVLVLKEDLAVLQTMVASLVERVSTGEQLLQEANRRLAEQEANAKLLANQVADLQQEALPVIMRTDAAQTPAATTTQPEDKMPATATAPQEDEAPPQDTGAESSSIASTCHE
ncbi:hypothetical protein EV702DRAFT_1043285 [Suillus placidus]|uniref:Uncharacterized protein n=1 Tax=Suillus placidus TaxID=48579 RepID=A0A9P7D625_9AGAM|nr:hypothetical protein EV702DRAFT_1043285 [Suillus placidus]